MEQEAPRLSNQRIAFALVLGCAPLGLWVVLNFMRPDLIAPMLNHVFGYLITLVELLLVLGGIALYLAAALQRGSGAKIGLGIAGLLLCTLPALFLILFGPIVFAFTYGNLDGRY
jgi:hypothetical protein